MIALFIAGCIVYVVCIVLYAFLSLLEIVTEQVQIVKKRRE